MVMLNNKRLSRWLAFFTLAATFALALPAQANTWPLPPPGSRVVGQNAVHVVEDNGGSLEAIAKKYNVGFPSVDFNKSEVLPIRLLPTKTVICDSS